MKVKIDGILDIPDIITSLLIGATPDPDIGFSKNITLTLDDTTLDRLSTILYLLYSEDAKEPKMEIVKKEDNTTKPISIEAYSRPKVQTTNKEEGGTRSILEIRNRSKAFINGSD